MKNNLLTIVLGCILLIVTCSCGSTANATSTTSSATPITHASPSPTILQVTRVLPPATTSLPPFDKTITDANEVQKLYSLALAAPVIPKGARMNCPESLAHYQYRLLFFHNKLMVSRMTLDDNGCIVLSINSDPRIHNASSNDFSSLLLKMMGRSSLQS
jgi:hypothetical protein